MKSISAEARIRVLEEALACFANTDKWAEPTLHTCGCRFIEWCDDESDPHPAEIAKAALGEST